MTWNWSIGLNNIHSALTREIGKVIIGQNRVIDELLIRSVQSRPLSAGRRSRPGQNVADQHSGSSSESEIQPHPNHPGLDASDITAQSVRGG
jgi:hypothetical protein